MGGPYLHASAHQANEPLHLVGHLLVGRLRLTHPTQRPKTLTSAFIPIETKNIESQLTCRCAYVTAARMVWMMAMISEPCAAVPKW
jgi:hypothetical protein